MAPRQAVRPGPHRRDRVPAPSTDRRPPDRPGGTERCIRRRGALHLPGHQRARRPRPPGHGDRWGPGPDAGRSSTGGRPCPGVVGGQGGRALLGRRDADIVHAHMTAAEAAAWLAHPVQRGPDRGHPSLRRRPRFEPAGPVAQPGHLPLPRPATSPSAGSWPTTIVGPVGPPGQRGARPGPGPPGLARPWSCCQRLTTEKSPDRGYPGLVGQRAGAAGLAAGRGRCGRPPAPTWSSWPHRLGVADSVDFAGPGGRHRPAARRVLDPPGPGPGRAVRALGGRGHGPRGAGGGRRRRGPPGDGRGRRAAVPPGDAAAAARALVDLADGRTRRLEVGAALRRRQRRLFSLVDHVDRLEQLYREVRGRDAAGSPDDRPPPVAAVDAVGGRQAPGGVRVRGSPVQVELHVGHPAPTSTAGPAIPADRRRSHSPGSSRNRAERSASAPGSPGGTSSPASPTTSGSAPLALATTGTPKPAPPPPPARTARPSSGAGPRARPGRRTGGRSRGSAPRPRGRGR